MRVLVASDLDGTLVYSRRSARLAAGERAELVCVERIDGAPAAFMTATAAGRLAEVARLAVFVPVTTRAPEQIARLTLPGPSRYAVAANGGLMYVDGEIDPAWSAAVANRLMAAAPFAEVRDHVRMAARADWRLRDVDGLLCYAVLGSDLAPEFVADEAAWAEERGWRLSLQGRKLYWVPRPLSKGAAVVEIGRRIRAELLLAAGDSLLDVDLLERADRGIHPRHGEIADSGWSAPHVTCTAGVGVRAGEQIAVWLAAQVLSAGGGAGS
ncbi:MAG: family hydrolase, partial [Pseudonocardiales bacterium]|nr:family hydrolase [Pseudonocardiales bacterium]